MQVPDDLRYSTDHEWARRDEGRVRVGITDYAQDALGDVVFVELPAVGSDGRRRGRPRRGRVDQVGVGDLRPVGRHGGRGERRLADAPEQLNQDPYGEGWICEIEVADPGDVAARCSTPSGYRSTHRILTGAPTGAGGGLAPTQGNGAEGPTTVEGVFCNNCGHRNPPEVNFCSSCGAVLPAHAARDHRHAAPGRRRRARPPDEEPSVTLAELPERRRACSW